MILLLIILLQGDLDAVSRLVDRADEAAAAKLEPFYAAALREELAARGKLGERFGRVAAVTVSSEMTLMEAASELSKAAGQRVDPEWAFDRDGSPPPVSLKLEKVSPMAALAELCRVAKARPFLWEERGYISLCTGEGPACRPSVYRNFLVRVERISRRLDVDFGRPGRERIELAFVVLWDRNAAAARLAGIELAEIADEKGKAVPVPERVEVGRERPYVTVFTGGMSVSGLRVSPAVAFDAVEGDALSRVRGWALVDAPLATSAFELKEDGTQSDAHVEVVREKTTVRLKGKGGFDVRKAVLEWRIADRAGLETDAFVSTREQGETVEASVGAQAGVGAMTLKVHRELMRRKVPFELKEIPIR